MTAWTMVHLIVALTSTPRVFSPVSLEQQRKVISRVFERYGDTLQRTLLPPLAAMKVRCDDDRRLAGLLPRFAAQEERIVTAWKSNTRALRDLIRPFNPVVALASEAEECGAADVGRRNPDFRERRDARWSSTCDGYSRGESIISHLIRDWSDECDAVRTSTYAPVVVALRRYLPAAAATVLVPGAGLARLPYDIASTGEHVIVEAIECSLTMVAAARSVLEYVQASGSPPPFVVYPNAARMLNQREASDRAWSIAISPGEGAGEGAGDIAARRRSVERISLVHAGFIEAARARIARGDAGVDAVVTSFFIDVCDDVVACIDAIASVLKPGGVWLNSGPLKYHFVEEEEDEDAAAAAALDEERDDRERFKNGTKRPFNPEFWNNRSKASSLAQRPLLSLDELVAVADALGFEVELRGARSVRYGCERTMQPSIYTGIPLMIATKR